MKLIVFAFLFLALTTLQVYAQTELKRRHLELELEEIPDTKGYEVKLSRIKDGNKKPPVIFKLQKNIWAAQLVPGKYEMAVRSVDMRGVPGEWSAPQEILVKIPAPEIISPQMGAKVIASDESKEKVEFKWNKVEGAEKYRVKVIDAQKKEVFEDVVSDPEVKFKLPVAQGYNWTVTPVFEKDLEGESTAVQTFDFYGPKLESPENSQLEEYNTQVVYWKKSDLAQEYAYTLEQKSANGWKMVDQKKVAKNGIKYSQALPTGEYRINVRSLAAYRMTSDPMVQEFKTENFSRSPAALEQIKSEASYDTSQKYFAMASYFVTILNYSSNSYDYNKTTSYAPIGGTGRLGFGYWFKDGGAWGIMGVADLSGYKIQGTNYIYPSLDVVGVYKNRLGAVGQLRVNFGLRYRDLPLTVGEINNVSEYSQSKTSTLGPVVVVNLAHGFTRKIGFQVNASIYPSIIGISTPNNQTNVSAISYQFGMLGSMKLNEFLVGFVGYAYRTEKASFDTDLAAFAINAPGIASPGPNTIDITGHYLNLMLEYGF